jgi:hypothetical protein
MIWISIHTGFQIPEPPTHGFISSLEMRDLAYDCSNITYDNEYVCNQPKSEHRVLALYDSAKKKVFLNPGWDISDVLDQSKFLHELVHHLQYANAYDKKVQCRELLEKQAYDLQHKWLLERGRSLKELQINEFFLSLLQECSYW